MLEDGPTEIVFCEEDKDGEDGGVGGEEVGEAWEEMLEEEGAGDAPCKVG